ncbi:MAG: HAD family phosphatase [Atopobiaceae bacterium]|nr:HAD family phosphatase [Atopobiaceae bacterium]
MIKLIATDLDKTFFDSDSRPPEGSFELIRELMDEGIRFCVSTGRWPDFAKERFAPVADEIDMICANGGVVYAAGECIASVPYNDDDVRMLVDFCAHFPTLHVVANAGGKNYVLEPERSLHSDVADDEFKRALANGSPDHIFGWPPEGVSITALGIGCSTVEDSLIYSLALELEMGDVFNFLPLNVPYFDVVPRKQNKAVGLSLVMEHYGIERDEVVCYGDSLNDYSMMRAADHPRAPENAMTVIKDISEKIVPSHLEQGVQQDMRLILEEVRAEKAALAAAADAAGSEEYK